MMKLFLLILIVNSIYAQCTELNQSECDSNSGCEWIEEYQNMNCGNYDNSQTQCQQYSEYGCSWEFSWGGWQNYGSYCAGGAFQINNSYCIEVEMPDCSELDQNTCNHPTYGIGCEWVENFEMEWCNFGDSGSCNSVPGCEWECDSWYTWLCGCEGQYQVDYSYCTDEIQLSECSEMTQQQCSNDNNCQWVSDMQYGNCSEFNQSPSACEATLGCYGAYQYPGWYSGWYCAGGNYEIDISYCDENEYQMGDINQDDRVNILDVIETISLIMNGNYNPIVDMDYNLSVNILDIIQMLDIILDEGA